MTSLSLKCDKVPVESLALTGKVFLHPDDYKVLRSKLPESQEGPFLRYEGFVFSFEQHKDNPKGKIGFNTVQRRFLKLSLDQVITVTSFYPEEPNGYLSELGLELDFLAKNREGASITREEISAALQRTFVGQYLTVDQHFLLEVSSYNLEVVVKSVQCIDLASLSEKKDFKPTSAPKGGILHVNTAFKLGKAPSSKINLTGGEETGGGIFQVDWNFEKMGIGGLDKEFGDIFRRAFASRLFPPKIVQKLGINHVKGILLYGPPGTGKTLMARQIGKMLNTTPPKIVNGPEVLNKYVGQSEENIRLLFKEAEDDQKANGDASKLHMIIFDEIDAICKQRGSRNDGTGVGDTVVNQLLSKMDGVDSLNNVLVIGMTNRKDLIDEALLRPGRFEVHMEINLPDEHGRLQILNIHTSKLRDSKALGPDVSIPELAKDTKNFSGADIEGLVKSATSFAFNRQIDVKTGVKVKQGDIIVSRTDFMEALKEVKPTFGVDEDDFQNLIPNGIFSWSSKVDNIFHQGNLFIEQVRHSPRTPIVSVLIEGQAGSGKTSIVTQLAKKSGYPFIKIINPETLVGYSETAKASRITKIFDDAHKSQLSCIIIDDLERLIDYVRIGPRFSNTILQTLIVLIKKPPPKGRRLLVLATTSNKRIIEDTELLSSFDVSLQAPQIENVDELKLALKHLDFLPGKNLDVALKNFVPPLSIKRLIMLTEMSRQGDPEEAVERFKDALTL